mgnify:CR=1 FL=1
MKTKSSPRAAFLNLRFLIGLLVSLTCGLVTLLTLADSSSRAPGDQADHIGSSIRDEFTPGGGQSALHSRVEGRTFARVTPEGVITENLLASPVKSVARATPERLSLAPLGNTLWQVDDENAIADGVAIDANDVWGAWTLQGARLGAYPIGGDGTPDFEFSSFGSGNSGVASAKEPIAWPIMESNAAGNDFRDAWLHVHKWRHTGLVVSVSCQTDPNLPASSKKVAVSRDGSTIAAVVSDSS